MPKKMNELTNGLKKFGFYILTAILGVVVTSFAYQMIGYASEDDCRTRSEESMKRDAELRKMIIELAKVTVENTKAASKLEGILQQIDKRLEDK